jgi:hypothetical protein
MVLLGVVSIFVFGCANNTTPEPSFTPLPEQMDKSLFTGIPCAAPCWRGLEVGKSNENDVMAILPSLNFIKQDSMQIYRTSMPGINGTYGPGVNVIAECINSSDTCLDLKVVNDVLTRIVIGLNYEITVEKAIEYLGNPNYVGYGIIGERFVCEVYLVWDSGRLVLVSRVEGVEGSDVAEKNCYTVRDTGKVLSSSLISEARYLSEAELDALMTPSSSNTFFEFTGTIPEQ